MLELDDAGWAAVDGWAYNATIEDIAFVEEELDKFARGIDLCERWFCQPDPLTGETVVYLREDLAFQIGRYSDQDPETMFTVRWVSNDP